MTDDIKISFEIQIFDVHGYDLTAVQCRLDHAAGQYCYPKSGYSRIDQGAGAHGFPGGDDMDPGMRDDMVKDISGSASFFAEQEALLFELVAGYGLSLFPAFVRGTQNAQLILHICLRDDPWIAGDTFDQGEIQGVCQDFMLQTVRLLDDDSYIDTGADLRVCFYISRQEL